MGRYTDYAPIGNTCPMIDEVVSFLNGIQWNEEEADLKSQAIQALEILEKIRNANSTLREWGNEEFKEKEYFEKEISQLQSRVLELEREVKGLEDELSDTNDAYNRCFDQLNEIKYEN